jgi:predicted RNA-binding Zn ribbon-like protein
VSPLDVHHPVALDAAQIREGIGTAEELTAWLAAHELGTGLVVVAEFVALRDAVCGIFRAVADGTPVSPPDLDAVNRAAAAVPYWPVLSLSGNGFEVHERTGCAAVPASRAALARDAMSLLAGPLRTELRACRAPGCVLFFVKDHPRREWCSATCGNRARVARHYRRHHG